MSGKPDIMHFHGLAERLLGSPARVAVARVLTASPNREWTGREVARAAGVSPSQALAALATLEAEGVCWQRTVGRASLWRVDTRHLLFRELRRLAHLDETVQRALRSMLEEGLRGSRASEAYLFGSVAEGRERWDSDVDLFVLFADRSAAARWRRKRDHLAEQVQHAFGAFLQVLVYDRAQLRAPQRRRLLDQARSKGIPLEVRP